MKYFKWVGPGERKNGLHFGKDIEHIMDCAQSVQDLNKLVCIAS